MKETSFYKGHRWSNEELKNLMSMWQSGDSVESIAGALGSTRSAISKIVVRLRANGVPLTRRTKGVPFGRSGKLWSQAELEFLVRRRMANATNEQIAIEMGRSWHSVASMTTKLRERGVLVPMRGQGVRKLYDIQILRSVLLNHKPEECSVVEIDNESNEAAVREAAK